MGLQKVWLDGTPQLRKRAVVAHGNFGVHAVAVALWESGGASATVIGGLPLPVRQAIFGLFHLVYRLVKRYEYARLSRYDNVCILCRRVTVSLCHCPTVSPFTCLTDVITQQHQNKFSFPSEDASETHVSQGMTTCAYCVAVSLYHCVTVSLCHCPTVTPLTCSLSLCHPPPPHRVMCWYIHETVTAPCVHTCITWSLCHCVPLHCPQMSSVQVTNMDRTALGSGCAPMPTMPT